MSTFEIIMAIINVAAIITVPIAAVFVGQMKSENVKRGWCADAKQKTQTDSDAGGRIWRNRLTPKR